MSSAPEPPAQVVSRATAARVAARVTGTLVCAVLVAAVLFAPGMIRVSQAQADGAQVVIAELLASNVDTADDQDGDSSDWIELWNRGGATVSLAGWRLVDGSNSWTFPSVSLTAGSRLVVWASDKDRSTGQLHTNFKLSAGGEPLSLIDSAGAIQHSYNPYPSQRTDISYGLGSNGIAGYMTPTPGEANGTAGAGIVATPQAQNGRGLYTTTVTEALSVATPAATITYTLDGTIPTNTSTVYTGPIDIAPDSSGVVTVRAKAFAAGMEPSDEATWSYVFPTARFPANAAAAGAFGDHPVVVLYTDDGGEPPIDPRAGARVEMIDPDPNLDGFAANVGVERSGDTGVTRLAKKSYRIAFGSQWGGPSELDYPMFNADWRGTQAPTTKFKRLDLHGGSFAADPVQIWTDYMINDRLVRDYQLDSGVPGTQGRYAHFFFNGNYWGMYQIRERFDNHYRASYSETPADDFEAAKMLFQLAGGVWSTSNGSGNLSRSVFSSSTYDSVAHIVGDPDPLLRLAAIELAIPTHQCEFLATSPMSGAAADPTIWLMNDSDGTFAYVPNPYGSASSGCLRGGSGMVGRWLRNSAELRGRFGEIVKELYCPGGAMTPEAMTDRMRRIRDDAAVLYPADHAKWGLNWLANADSLIATIARDDGADFVAKIVAAGHIDGCDRAPTLETLANMASTTVQPVDIAVVATDPEGAAVTFSAAGLPSGLSISPSTGRITGTATSAGTHAVTISATDGTNNTSTTGLSWQVLAAGANSVAVINEYNASTSKDWTGTDPAFGAGSVEGNGGDWVELVVVANGVDLRGYAIEFWDRDNQAELLAMRRSLTLADVAALSDVAAGTVITLAESQAEDLSYDPDNGDWTIALTSNDLGQGSGITAATQSNFDTNRHEMRILLRNATGTALGELVGETDTWRSVTGDNAGSDEVMARCGAIADGDSFAPVATESTFGEPNRCPGVYDQYGEILDLRGVPMGDVNCSGAVDQGDVTTILESLVGHRRAGTCSGTGYVDRAGDRNGDSATDLADARLTAVCVAAENC